LAINESHTAKLYDRQIPFWFRSIFALLTLALSGILFRALFSKQDDLFGIPLARIMLVSASFLLLCLPLTIALWFYPESGFSITIYWLARLLREQVYVLALIGILYLITIRAPLVSLRGVTSYLAFVVMFAMGLYLKPVNDIGLPHPSLVKLNLFFQRVPKLVQKIPSLILQVSASLMPVAAVSFVIYVVFGSRLHAYGPYSFWNDEVAYWDWLRSFIHVGFRSGYNSPNELLPVFEFSRYGEASPFYLYIYGMIGKLTGWFTGLPILINFLILTLSIFLFVRSLRLDNTQVLFIGVTLVLTWPVLLYLPLTTHETLNQVIGILLTLVFAKLIRDQVEPGLWGRVALVLLVYIATLVRLSWGLMLIPILFYCQRGTIARRGLVAIMMGGAFYISAVVLIGYFLPPINNSVFATVQSSLAEGPQVLLHLVRLQFYYMFKFKTLNPNMATLLQMVIVMGWSINQLWKSQKSKSLNSAILTQDGMLDLYNMSSLLVAGLLFYLQEGFYRTFAPALLMVYLLRVIRKDYRHLVALLLINVLFFHSYLTFYAKVGDYRIVESDYKHETLPDSHIQTEINRLIVYDPNAKNPWCNTLLIPLGYYDSRLMLIPEGIGISFILDQKTYQPPIKSRYVLFDPVTYKLYRESTDLTLLANLSIGDLYLNQDIDCPANP